MDGFTPVCSGCRTEQPRLRYVSLETTEIFCSISCAKFFYSSGEGSRESSTAFIGYGARLSNSFSFFDGTGTEHQVHQYITQLAVEALEAEQGFSDIFEFIQQHKKTNETYRLTAERLLSGNLWSEAPVKGGQHMRLLKKVSRAKMQRALEKHPVETDGVMLSDRFRYNAHRWPLVAAHVWKSLAYGADVVLLGGAAGRRLDTLHWHAMLEREAAPQPVARALQRTRDYVAARFRQAVETCDLFWLGAAMHTIQDSYAVGHCKRTFPRNTANSELLPRFSRGGTLRQTMDNDSCASSVLEEIIVAPLMGARRVHHARYDQMRAFTRDIPAVIRDECIGACAFLLQQFSQSLLTPSATAVIIQNVNDSINKHIFNCFYLYICNKMLMWRRC